MKYEPKKCTNPKCDGYYCQESWDWNCVVCGRGGQPFLTSPGPQGQVGWLPKTKGEKIWAINRLFERCGKSVLGVVK